MESNIGLFELENILKDIITIGNFNDELSFHTLTFNIIENFNKENIQDLIKKYTDKIHNMYLDNEFNKSYYIYTYEISSELHIHIHLLLNKQCEKVEKKELMEYWNKLNNWEFYNKRSLLIKNNEEYTDIELQELLIKENKEELKNKNYALPLLLLKYMFKNIFNVDCVLKIYYMIYPINLVGGQLYINLKDYIEKLNKIYLQTIYNYYKVYNPFLEKIEEQEKLNYIYIKWKIYFKKFFNKLDELLKNIQKEQDIIKKQKLIEQEVLIKTNSISEIKLYSIGEKNFKILKRILLKYLNKKIEVNKHDLIIFLEEPKNTIFYVLETLMKLIRYYKKDIKSLKEEEKEQERELEKDFIYTEAYFKSIMQNLYKTQLLNINLYNHKELYKKKDLTFLENLNELKNKNNNLYLNLIDFYESNENKIIENTKNITNIYLYNQLIIEEAIGLWVVEILTVLYEINVIEKINENNIRSVTKEKNQSYFSLTKDFLNILILESVINEIIPPLLIEPKNYEEQEKQYKGGYLILSNVLFSQNENLKYQMNNKILKTINQTQKIPMYINKKYFNYLIYNKINEIEKMTGLKLKYFEENYLDLDETQQNIKKVPEAFLIHEFFLTLYMAEIFQNDIIWYISKLDERGRKYDVGYPLNFYRDKIFRNIFLLDKENVLKNIKEPIKIRNMYYKIYKEYIDKIWNEEGYNKYNILSNPIESLVGFDAKNQIYQIIGGLIKDKKLLQLSHVIDLKTSYSFYDVYEYFLMKLRFELNKDEYFIKLIEIFNKRIKIIEGSIKKGMKKITSNEILFLLDRKWIKNILMTYGYNKGIPGLIQITYEKIFKNTWFIEVSKLLLNKIITQIIVKLLNIFNTEIDTLKNLKLIFNGLISLSYLLEQPLYISIDNQTGFYQYYTELETFSFRKWKKDGLNDKGKPKWKLIRISYISYEKIKKNKKGSNAILPNTCHYIDSILMYNILEKVIELKIPIKTIHDSFYLNIKYKEYIYNLYYEEYIKLFRENILEKIIINILIKFQTNKDFNDFINKFNINIENILKKDLIKIKLKTLNETEKNIYNIIKKVHVNYEKIKASENYIKEDLEQFILNNKHKEIIK